MSQTKFVKHQKYGYCRESEEFWASRGDNAFSKVKPFSFHFSTKILLRKIVETIFLRFCGRIEQKKNFFMIPIALRTFFVQIFGQTPVRNGWSASHQDLSREDVTFLLSKSSSPNQNKAPKWIWGRTVMQREEWPQPFCLNTKQHNF